MNGSLDIDLLLYLKYMIASHLFELRPISLTVKQIFYIKSYKSQLLYVFFMNGS